MDSSDNKYIMVEELQQASWQKTPPKTCPELVEGIIHEIIEAAGNCYSGLKPSSAIDPQNTGGKPDEYAHDLAMEIQKNKVDKDNICQCCGITD